MRAWKSVLIFVFLISISCSLNLLHTKEGSPSSPSLQIEGTLLTEQQTPSPDSKAEHVAVFADKGLGRRDQKANSVKEICSNSELRLCHQSKFNIAQDNQIASLQSPYVRLRDCFVIHSNKGTALGSKLKSLWRENQSTVKGGN